MCGPEKRNYGASFFHHFNFAWKWFANFNDEVALVPNVVRVLLDCCAYFFIFRIRIVGLLSSSCFDDDFKLDVDE